MAQVYTRRLGWAQVNTAASSAPVFTAAEGFVTVVRSISLTNFAVAPSLVAVYITAGPDTLQIYRMSVPATTTIVLDLRQVVEPFETLSLFADPGPCQVLITGYRFLED